MAQGRLSGGIAEGRRCCRESYRPSPLAPLPFQEGGERWYLGDTPKPLPKGFRPSGLPFFLTPPGRDWVAGINPRPTDILVSSLTNGPG